MRLGSASDTGRLIRGISRYRKSFLGSTHVRRRQEVGGRRRRPIEKFVVEIDVRVCGCFGRGRAAL
jgi:hypothetical protein